MRILQAQVLEDLVAMEVAMREEVEEVDLVQQRPLVSHKLTTQHTAGKDMEIRYCTPSICSISLCYCTNITNIV